MKIVIDISEEDYEKNKRAALDYHTLRFAVMEGTPLPKGHWIEQEGYDWDTYYDCSECGESFYPIDGTPTDNLYNFCPNCGADMRGEENGNTMS